MFPIGVMYYFGTNLDNRFAVPDFWPRAEQSHKIPYEKEEIREELQRLRAQRLARRARRLEEEGGQAQQVPGGGGGGESGAGTDS